MEACRQEREKKWAEERARQVALRKQQEAQQAAHIAAAAQQRADKERLAATLHQGRWLDFWRFCVGHGGRVRLRFRNTRTFNQTKRLDICPVCLEQSVHLYPELFDAAVFDPTYCRCPQIGST
jgi:hypothetical protein